jgi:ribosome-associated translation inhibitor RaiA
MKFSVTFKNAEFIGRGKFEAVLEDWMVRHVKPREKYRGFTDHALSATISKQDNEEGSFSIKLYMHVPPNTILVARGEANHFQPAIEKALEALLRHFKNHIDRMRYQDANKRQSRRSRLESLKDRKKNILAPELLTEASTIIESLLPKLENAIRRELTFLRSHGDLPHSYPTTQDILDEVIPGALPDWKPGIDNNAAYLRLLREMHEVLNREVGASHAYGDIVSLETLAPNDAMDQAESMVGEEFYEFYQHQTLNTQAAIETCLSLFMSRICYCHH